MENWKERIEEQLVGYTCQKQQKQASQSNTVISYAEPFYIPSHRIISVGTCLSLIKLAKSL